MAGSSAEGRGKAGSWGTPGSSGSQVGWLVLLGVIWGSAFPVIRFGILAGVSPLPLGAARFAIAAAIMAALSARGRSPWPNAREAAKLAVLGGMLFVGGYAAFLNLGESSISSGLSAILVATLPLWTVLFGLAILQQERIGRIGALGLALGFAGLVVLFLPSVRSGLTSFAVGEIWVVCAAVTAAIGTVLIRKYLPGSPGTRGLTIEFGSAALLLAAVSLVPGVGDAVPLNRDAVLAIVYLALLPSGVGFAIYFELLRRVGAVGANLVSYVNPLAGVAIGVVLLSETVTLVEVVGFALVLLGLSAFQWEHARRARPPRPSVSVGGRTDGP